MGLLGVFKRIIKGKEVRALWRERDKIKDLIVELAGAFADNGKIDPDEYVSIGRRAYDVAKALGWL